MKFRYTTDVPAFLGTPEQWVEERLRILMDKYYRSTPLLEAWPDYARLPDNPKKVYMWNINTNMNIDTA